MKIRIFFILSLLTLSFFACKRDGQGVLSEKARQDLEVASEARDGDLQNPGGVKDVKSEAENAQQETEKSLDHLDQQ